MDASPVDDKLAVTIPDKLKIWIWKCIEDGSMTKKELYDILVDDHNIFPGVARHELNWTGEDSWVKMLDEDSSYPLPCLNIQLKESILGGFGVFATAQFHKDDIIEYCRAIQFDDNQLSPDCIFRDYIHGDEHGTSAYLLMGYGDLYNHSDDPNASFNDWADVECNLTKILALRHIQPGEEITVSYGPDWWATRQHVAKSKGPCET